VGFYFFLESVLKLSLLFVLQECFTVSLCFFTWKMLAIMQLFSVVRLWCGSSCFMITIWGKGKLSDGYS